MIPDEATTARKQSCRYAEFMAAQDALSGEPAITLEEIEPIERRNNDTPF